MDILDTIVKERDLPAEALPGLLKNLSPERRALLALRLNKNGDATTSGRIIPRRDRSIPAPASFAQQRLWFLDQLTPGLSAYSINLPIRLNGLLNVAALGQSLDELSRRHEILRTTFAGVDGQPVQVISPYQSLNLPVLDLSELPETERGIRAQHLVNEELQKPFDLARGPLMRASLLRLNSYEHIILFSMHHIIADEWSMGILIKEGSALYNAFATGQPSPLPELSIQYADFAYWQQHWLTGDVLEAQLAYWREHLGGAPEMLALPTDRPRPAVQGFRGATQGLVLDATVSDTLRGFARSQGVTLFMTLLAAFQVLLARLSGQTDVVVGTPIANRNRREVEGLIGFFVNTLALRVEVKGEESFRELVGRVREVAVGAYAHQDLPFERLVEELQPKRSLSHSPIFQVMFLLQNARANELSFPDLTLSMVRGEAKGSSPFDMSLSVTDGDDSMSLSLEYDIDLFDEPTVQRMLENFEVLLHGIAVNPEQSISDLPLLTDAERQRLLIEWNDTLADYPRDQCLHQLFEEAVERRPEAIAIVCEDEQLTYAEMNARANQLARHLQKLGVGPDVLVGICMERSLEMVVGLLGILKAGGAYLPLDPSYPRERLSFMLSDSEVSILLTQGHLLDSLPEHEAQTICLDVDWRRIEQESTKNPSAEVTVENLAYVIYTSGSTGKPKGVLTPHRAIVNFCFAASRVYNIVPNDRVLQFASLSFDTSAEEIYPTLISGAALVLRNEEMLGSVDQFLPQCGRWGVTVLDLPTAYWHHLTPQLGQYSGSQRERLGLPESVRLVIIGGEKAQGEQVARWSTAVSERVLLVNSYGPTEATVVAASCELNNADRSFSEAPIGRPLMNVRLYVLDRAGQPVPLRVEGELHIAGEGLAHGYLRHPELTAEKFVPDAFSGVPGARLYKTGDLVRYLPDGNLEFIGRVDEQVKVRGFRIEPGEIESVLTQYAGVKEALVLLSDDTPGEPRLTAYLVVDRDSLTISELRSFLRGKLPSYMMPAYFVVLEQLPLMPNGKLDRRALPAPESAREELDKAYAAPRNAIEEVLVGLWSEVLHLERIDINENFFDIGGHSLLATQLTSRIREAFKVELAVRALFEAPTIAALALRIDSEIIAGQCLLAPAIEPISRAQELPLSFAQQRLWFLDQLEPDSSSYSMPAAVRLKGELNIAALEQTLTEIVRRHEVLRTRFAVVDGRPVQIIEQAEAVVLPVLDLSGLEEAEREAEARRLATEEAQRPFDLLHGPLLRASLLRLGAQEHITLFNMHHIITDGWSMGIFINEVSALYEAFYTGQPSPLPELSIQYADFAYWQQHWLTGDVLEAQLAYWREHLGGAPEMLVLPTDRPRPAVQGFRGATHSLVLDEEVSQELRSLSRREGVTLFMTLLAAFQVLLARLSGQTDVVVGTPIANRNRREAEGLIGFFVNTLALRIEVKGDESFRELVGRVREVAVGAYAHQDLPFERLVEELQPKRSLSHTPLFQVMFSLQNAPEGKAVELPGMQLRGLEIANNTAKFDITLTLSEFNRELVGSINYNTDLFDAATIHRMAGYLQALLREIVAQPDKRLSELLILADSERELLLVEFNQTDREYSGDACIHELFEAQVEQMPDRIAVAYELNELTYAQLNSRANQLAHHLRKLGVTPDLAVGLCLERSVDLLVGLIGILKAGGAYVPLDPALPIDRLTMMLDDVGAKILITKEILTKGLSGYRTVYLDADVDLLALEDSGNPESKISPWNLVYVIFTSGSTGKPKGVAVEHRQLVNYVAAIRDRLGLTTGGSFAMISTFAADLGNTVLFPSLTTGGTLHLISEERATDPDALAEYLLLNPVDYLKIVPSHLAALLSAARPADILPRQGLVLGGEACSWRLLEKIESLAGHCVVFNHYGPTETTVGAVVARTSVEASHRSTTVPLGRPLANTKTYVLDKSYQPVPLGVPGELHIGGDGVVRGYVNRAGLTAEKFTPDPFTKKAGARLYKTGDLARYLPDGDIEFLGRFDHQVKVRGFRIEPGEIESVLTQHTAVGEAVVLAREDTPGEKHLVSYVVAQQQHTISVTELRTFLRERLPEYMIPAAFVVLDQMPLTPNGKIDKRALPPPNQTQHELERPYIAARDVLELKLVQIWEDILRINPVGVKDNFFELGGHSLLAVSLMARIQHSLGHKLPLTALFQGATVEHLATLIRQQEEGRPPLFSSLVAIQSDGEKTPFFCVHGAGGNVFCFVALARHLGLDQPFYGLQARGLEGEHSPHNGIEEMAAHYIAAIRSFRPAGPYFLGGWSMGGVVAFEMARQLEAQGQEVAMLALLDAPAPSAEDVHWEDDGITLMAAFAQDVGLPLDSLAISDEHLQLAPPELMAYVLQKAKTANMVPPDVDLVHLEFLLEVFKANVRARRNYSPRVSSCPLVLLKASERLADAAENSSLGWDNLTPGAIEIRLVPGNHYSMLREPQVMGLAAELKACLESVDKVMAGCNAE